MKVIDLGVCEYPQSEMVQKEIHKKRTKEEIEDTVIFCVHPPVITLGKHGKIENLLVSLEELKRRGIAFYRTERGGDITYHGYGQLLIYPIFFLPGGISEIRRFITWWAGILIATLKTFGIEADVQEKKIGIYVGEKKIASIGFALKDQVTYHGLALNVNSDLKPFSLIHPCGQKEAKMTAMENILGRRLEMGEVKERIIKCLMTDK